MPKFLPRAFFMVCLIWFASAAMGAETGTLRGSVRDASNQAPLEGVEVSIEGSKLPGGRTQTTNSRGSYWFPVLPPGQYRITFIRDGYQTKAFDATVRLDQTTTLPHADLNLLTFAAEVIEIVETAPAIDNTQSAIGQNVQEEFLDRLPMPRSLAGIFSTMPGITSTDYSSGGPSSSNPSVRGEGPYGNNYLLEGFSTRDPVSKTMGLSLPFDALQEVSVFTDGAPAEFGNFTGMIANVLLKSGGNETHGSVTYIFRRHAYLTERDDGPLYRAAASIAPGRSFGTYEIMGEETNKRRFLFQNPVLTLSGPIVEDKLWYFTLFEFSSGWNQPEGTEVITRIDQDYSLLTRFTYSPIEDGNTLINLTAQKQAYVVDNAGAGVNVAPEATVKGISDVLYLNANAKSVLSPFVVLEAKWNLSRDEYYEEPKSGNPLLPSYRDIATGERYGNTSSLYSSLRARQGFALHLTRFVAELAGTHMFKGGYEYHKVKNVEEFEFTGGIGTLEDPAYEYVYDNGEPAQRRERYNVGPIGHEGFNSVLFLQDQWQPAPSLTLNLGIRADSEELLQNDNRTTVFQWAYAPRFGMAWDVTRNAENLITANAGRYYDINGLGFVSWADTLSANYFKNCDYNQETGEYDQNCWTQDPVQDPSLYAQSLRPYYMDKFTLGFTRAVTPLIAVGIKGIMSTTRDLPEDENVDGHYWLISNPENKFRDYWGLELTAERKFADNWQFLTSLTYSRSRGTSPGSFEAGTDEGTGGNGNEVGIFLDDIADPYVRLAQDYFGIDFAGMGYAPYETVGQQFSGNTAGWYGYLPYHSFVFIKLSGSYQFKFGTELGMSYQFDSGHAWQRRGIQPLYGDHVVFPEGRGVRFMPPVHYLDLRVAHRFKLPHGFNLLAELSLFNVLDLEKEIAYYENFDTTRQVEVDSNGSYYYVEPTEMEGAPDEVVPLLFGQVFARQPPRSIRANITVSF